MRSLMRVKEIATLFQTVIPISWRNKGLGKGGKREAKGELRDENGQIFPIRSTGSEAVVEVVPIVAHMKIGINPWARSAFTVAST
jgi:bifunctional DNA-binding transcriptional regulator/antitoxin component of YhaV-PrlF toxin-antitoxin module